MRKIICVLLSVLLVLSAADISFGAFDITDEGALRGCDPAEENSLNPNHWSGGMHVGSRSGVSETALVSIYDINGELYTTNEFAVGESFRVYTTLDAYKAAERGRIAAIEAYQTYSDSVLQLVDYSFPILDREADVVANTQQVGKIVYNASTPSVTDPFIFNSYDDCVIVTEFTVTGAGSAEIHNTIQTLAAADEMLTPIIKNGESVTEKPVSLSVSFYAAEPVYDPTEMPTQAPTDAPWYASEYPTWPDSTSACCETEYPTWSEYTEPWWQSTEYPTWPEYTEPWWQSTEDPTWPNSTSACCETEVPIDEHVHYLFFVPEETNYYAGYYIQAHYVCYYCEKMFADATGLVEVTYDDLIRYLDIMPSEPAIPTEPHPYHPSTPDQPGCQHYYTYERDTNYVSYDWGYTYQTVTVCEDCGDELCRVDRVVQDSSYVDAEYDHYDSYTVTEDTPYSEEAIIACGGSMYDVQTVYFRAPSDWANKFNTFYGPDDSEPYMHVCVYWWSGVGSRWPDGTGVCWVGYQAHLVDKQNRIYRAYVPLETPLVCWNNGVNGGMDPSKEEFAYACQLADVNVEGAYPGDYDTLPEGTPNEYDMDGCIAIINYDEYITNPLTNINIFGSDWYVYYGDGCYGCYPTYSDNFRDKKHSCINPEHDHFSDPLFSEGIIYFDADSAGWDDPEYALFYIYEIGETDNMELAPWGSKKLRGTYEGNGIWSFDAGSLGMVEGKQYGVIFNNTSTYAETYPLLLDTTCFGDTAYCDTSKIIENPVDSSRGSVEARWTKSDYGPILNITSIGNVVGETVPSCTSAYQLLVNFLASRGTDGLQNALKYNGKDAKTTIDDVGAALGLSRNQIKDAVYEARDTGSSINGNTNDWTEYYPNEDMFGYVVGSYYLVGNIRGADAGTSDVDPNLRFMSDTSEQMKLSGVMLFEGDSVKAARYNGGNAFTIYPDGIGRELSIDRSGIYDFYFKPYELGNPNYWYITPYFSEDLPDIMRGDADCDGEISSIDATWIQRYLSFLRIPGSFDEYAADVDGDGEVSSLDATWIQRYLAHISIPYEIGESIG